ncbi:MAG: hypothetical protein ACXVCE_04080, partial [Bacteriovorax sp.]
KKASDKIYPVELIKPEIKIGNEETLLIKKEDQRPEHLYYVGLSKGGLIYKLPALSGPGPDFSQDFIGVSLAKKDANHFFLYKGSLEFGLDWQRYKRESGIFEQKINIYQVNLIQNFDLGWTLRHSLFFSTGLGVAPIYLTAEKSIFGNSLSNFGGVGILKLDFIMPIKNFPEIDLGLKGAWGNVGGQEIFLSTLNLGIQFE